MTPSQEHLTQRIWHLAKIKPYRDHLTPYRDHMTPLKTIWHLHETILHLFETIWHLFENNWNFPETVLNHKKTIWHLPQTIWVLTKTFWHLTKTVWHLHKTIWHLPQTIWHLPKTMWNPPKIMWHLPMPYNTFPILPGTGLASLSEALPPCQRPASIRHLFRPQCQPNQTYCTAGEGVLDCGLGPRLVSRILTKKSLGATVLKQGAEQQRISLFFKLECLK